MEPLNNELPKKGRVLWFNPNMTVNQEDQSLLAILGEMHLMKHFDVRKEAIKFLQHSDKRWVVITSGTEGKEFVEAIHDLINVVSIIVYCGTPSLHKPWTSQHSKCETVTNRPELLLDKLGELQKSKKLESNVFICKTIWIDEKKENVQMQEQDRKRIHLRQFADEKEALTFLNANSDQWLVVICGGTEKSEGIVKALHECSKVEGIIINFRGEKGDRSWTLNHELCKIQNLVEDDVQEVLGELMNTHKKNLTRNLLHIAKDSEDRALVRGYRVVAKYLTPNAKVPVTGTPAGYYEKRDDICLKFLFISSLCIRKNKIIPSRVLKELIDLHPSEEQKIISMFKKSFNTNQNLLQAFVNLYTAQFLYDKFNKKYAETKYDTVMHITAMCMKELAKQLPQNPKLNVKGVVLWRGLDDCSSDYKMGEDNGYWSSFTSCTPSRAIAQQKFYCPGGVLFEIHLSSTNPHPHIVVPDAWRDSTIPTEAEVLLLPYFPLKVKEIRKEKDASGEIGTVIVVVQDETKNVLGSNAQRIKEYWSGYLNLIAFPALDKIYSKIEESIIKNINLTGYFQKEFVSDSKLFMENFKGNFNKRIEKLLEEACEATCKKFADQTEFIRLLFYHLDFEALSNSQTFFIFSTQLQEIVLENRCNPKEMEKLLNDKLLSKLSESVSIRESEMATWKSALGIVWTALKDAVLEDCTA
jgi:precorrin-6B methylase 2